MKIEIEYSKLKSLLHAATGNVRDFVMNQDEFINNHLGIPPLLTAEVNNVKPNYSQTQCCTLLLFSCGTLVKAKYGNIEGMITCQNIRFDKVQYEVSYFNNGEQKAIWMNENEFTTDVKKYAIGFAK